MKILMFGKTGQVASEVQRQADIIALGRDSADLSDPAACAAAIAAHRPDAVINAAAWTAVDRAEAEEVAAGVINGDAPGAMARACADLGIPFVHISTDYVFDGSGTAPWRETDTVSPQNAYGRTKLAGEEEIVAAGGTYAILRTSWVFSAHGTNFVKTMLCLSETRDALNVVDDQIGGPTPAEAIAAACLSIAAQLQQDASKSGIYHFGGQPGVSWAEFARAVFERAGRSVRVSGIPTRDYPTPAARPLNSRLNCGAVKTAFRIDAPDWQAGLDRVLKELERTT
ncbi:hypothetical protein P775_06830 [Puniceibacterium antarcticum]|uniref:dTDP-4-dehydrorhamnose reductase n=1 Tax=Puniceibacterium antarcticum TaxID=1206336 RepID=A0A2G8RHB3_9RHOB|nr:dTDP-4-dehydrorhamnose reductase [Puniceibacterium antarcticum]PIL20975.1 hypothetical protein P775_06830 [Puniceibacterium antarcticum]